MMYGRTICRVQKTAPEVMPQPNESEYNPHAPHLRAPPAQRNVPRGGKQRERGVRNWNFIAKQKRAEMKMQKGSKGGRAHM
jgi:hypothetical protein